MPFVTVVTLGSSASSDFVVKSGPSYRNISGGKKSQLTRVRAVCEDELFRQSKSYIKHRTDGNFGKGPKFAKGGTLAANRRKCVSFVDLSVVGKRAPSESGYSTASSGSSTSSAESGSGPCTSRVLIGPSERERDVSVWVDGGNISSNGHRESLPVHVHNGKDVNNNSGASVGGKATVFKSWIRNKLSLNKNGKYSFEGSTTNLAHFGVKVNKSLLVDFASETECTKIKCYDVKQTDNDYRIFSSGDSGQVLADVDGDCNLFVKECLKTYSTPFLELVDRAPGDDEDVVDGVILNGKSQENGGLQSSKAPSWFWRSWSQNRGAQLDEAGVAFEEKLSVVHKEENLGDRFVQVKWDDSEESFFLTVWTQEAGRGYICRIDLSDVDTLWHNDSKISVGQDLVLISEQRKNQLRDLYVVCVELGCFDKAAALASTANVDRVDRVVSLFQKVVTDLMPCEKPLEKKGLIRAQHKTLDPHWVALQLECLDFRLRTETGDPVEPYYVIVSLFDVKNGRKLSEDYHVTVNADGRVEDNTNVYFRVSEANEQIFVVVRIEKTLQASDFDAYLRGNPDGKTGSRISKGVAASPLFTSTERYRMPLCWCAKQLFRRGNVTDGSSPTSWAVDLDSAFSPFFKHEKSWDEELVKILVDIKKPEKFAKLTLVPGALKVKLESVDPDEVAELHYGRAPNCSKAKFIAEFPHNSIENFKTFQHHLYVYPVQLNLNALGGKTRARNILCRVFLRSEDDIEASPLETNPVDGRIASYVLHHRTNPEWYTEIKLNLPVALDPRLHLLFQFLHISCSFEKASKTKQVENVVGYAWIPLLNKFRFIGGEHVLPVAATLPSGYLQIQPLGLGRGYSGPEIAWLDKCTFSAKLNLVSTVWTKCGSLGAFFAHAEKYLQKGGSSAKFHCDDETTIKSIKSLETVDFGTLRDFYPTLINQICQVASTSKAVASASLRFMISSFHSLIAEGLESIIEDYIDRRFLSVSAAKGSGDSLAVNNNVADVIVDAWIDLFETADGATIASSLEQSKYLFSLIYKSIAVQGYSCINAEDSKLVKLVQLFTSEVVQRCQPDYPVAASANRNIIDFIGKLLSVITQRHVVFAAINAYLACFGPGDSHKIQDFKYSLLISIVRHSLFLELNSAPGDEEFTRLENILWAKRHFLVATVMKQSRSGLGEVSHVRTLALKPVVTGLSLHEQNQSNSPMWVPWLRVVCDNLHRISNSSLTQSNSSRFSSVSTVLSSTSSAVIRAALSKTISNDGHSVVSSQHSHGSSFASIGINHRAMESARSSTLSLKLPNGLTPSHSQNSSMTNINHLGDNKSIGSGERMSIDRVSISSGYLEAISAIKTSNPAASSVAPSIVSCGSNSETIVNESDSNNGSGDGTSIDKESVDILEDDTVSKGAQSVANTDAEKSNVVLRRYDKLNDMETSQLLLSGLYLLKTIGESGLRSFWARSTLQERASLLQMIYIACTHFVNARKNNTITRKKVVGIIIPPTMPPSPRSSMLPGKKWSSLPSKGIPEDDSSLKAAKSEESFASDMASCWRALSTEATFICLDALSSLCNICKGEMNEMRDVIRTTLDVAKRSEDTRTISEALRNLYRIEELPNVVFAKGNEDLSHLLFCELLTGFGTSYLTKICVAILTKLFLYDSNRTTSQSLLSLSSLTLNQCIVHNFRKSLALLERGISINDRSSFVLSITEKLSFIDVNDFDGSVSPPERMKCSSSSSTNSFKSLSSSGSRSERKLSKNSYPVRLSTILNSLWMLKSCSNQYRTAELYLKLANSYSHYARARLRMDAFDALRDEHLASKKYSEALMCELHIAARLARQLDVPDVRKIMLGISQNLNVEFEDTDEVEEAESTECLVQKLETCVLLCDRAERFELMLEVYRILVDIQESQSDYAALEHSYSQMSKACTPLQNKKERYLGTYYRVALYHPKKELITRPVDVYVYKEPNVTSLMEICHKVELAEGAKIISGDVDSIPDDDNMYATITHVTPIPSESPRRKLWSEDFRKHQNVSKFTYDTPFAVKSQDKISVDNKAAVNQQWKRRTTVTTEFTFPAVVSRLRVVESEEEDLSPIVVAIDDMQRRVFELRTEMQAHPQDLKRIQLRLQGSVSVQVNQGPLAYARAFLEKECEYPFNDIHRLKSIYRDFVECCGHLLELNGKLITSDQTEYHSQLKSDYQRLCQVLSGYIGLPEHNMDSRMSRISISSY